MKKLVLSALIIEALSPVLGFAAEFVSGPYVGIEAGRAIEPDLTQGEANSLLSRTSGGSASVTENTSVTYGRIFAGYKTTENIDLEVGYTKANDVSITVSGISGITEGSKTYTGNVIAKYSAYDYSVLLRPSISSGWNGAFFRVGGHNSNFDKVESLTFPATSFTTSTTDSAHNSGLMFGVGYDYESTKNLSFRAEYRYLPNVQGDKFSSFGVAAKYAF